MSGIFGRAPKILRAQIQGMSSQSQDTEVACLERSKRCIDMSQSGAIPLLSQASTTELVTGSPRMTSVIRSTDYLVGIIHAGQVSRRGWNEAVRSTMGILANRHDCRSALFLRSMVEIVGLVVSRLGLCMLMEGTIQLGSSSIERSMVRDFAPWKHVVGQVRSTPPHPTSHIPNPDAEALSSPSRRTERRRERFHNCFEATIL